MVQHAAAGGSFAAGEPSRLVRWFTRISGEFRLRRRVRLFVRSSGELLRQFEQLGCLATDMEVAEFHGRNERPAVR